MTIVFNPSSVQYANFKLFYWYPPVALLDDHFLTNENFSPSLTEKLEMRTAKELSVFFV